MKKQLLITLAIWMVALTLCAQTPTPPKPRTSSVVMSEIIMTRSDLYGLEKACEQVKEKEDKLKSLVEEYNKLKEQEDKAPK